MTKRAKETEFLTLAFSEILKNKFYENLGQIFVSQALEM